MMHQQAQPCRAGTTDLGPVAAAVDGFVVRTSDRKAGEKSPLHIKRMKMCAFNLLLMVLMTGTIIFLSQTFPAGNTSVLSVFL
jgi:hypothetical protein